MIYSSKRFPDSSLDEIEDYSSSDGTDSDFELFEDQEEEISEIEDLPQNSNVSEPKWTSNRNLRIKEWLPDFKLIPGVKNCNLNNDDHPKRFFHLIFPEDLFENIRDWTNKRAHRSINNQSRRKNKMQTWKKLTMNEFKAFVGIIISMGIVQLPSVKSYWNAHSKIFSNQGIRELMPRQRFLDIYTNLCFRDDNIGDNAPKMSKIDQDSIAIISNSQFYYTPNRYLSLDEGTIPFSGRSQLKTYNPLKPIKYGIRVYMLCDESNAFVVSWKIHSAEESNCIYGSTYSIVMKLADGIENEGYILYMDRYYTGLRLFNDLKDIGIGAAGTVQANRLSLPTSIKDDISKLQLHESLVYRGPATMLLTVWKDHKLVYLLSNFHSEDTIERERRVKLDKKMEKEKDEGDTYPRQNISIPRCIDDYTSHMGGVDTFDQMASYYLPHLKSRRWYVKVFFHLLEVSLINSFNIYKEVTNKKISHLDYREEVVRGLVEALRQDNQIEMSKSKFSSGTKKTSDSQVLEPVLKMPLNDNDRIKVPMSISKITKKLDFGTQSEKKNEENKNDSENKRKALELETCEIANIPSTQKKPDNRRQCEICKSGLIKKEDVIIKPCQTRFWCKTHEYPICILGCYDRHIKEMRTKLKNCKKSTKPV